MKREPLAPLAAAVARDLDETLNLGFLQQPAALRQHLPRVAMLLTELCRRVDAVTQPRAVLTTEDPQAEFRPRGAGEVYHPTVRE